MATQITGQPIPTISQQSNVYVEAKQNWADTWQIVDYLEPINASASVSPNTPSAELLYQYGDIKREDQTAFSVYTPLNIVNYYIRILSADANGIHVLWVGVVAEETFKPHGDSVNAQGDQILTAYGLEHLLDRKPIVGAYTDNGYIDWTPTFNDNTDLKKDIGNRSDAESGGAYLFSTDGNKWTAQDILVYALTYYKPEGLTLTLSGQFSVLANLEPIVRVEGLTLKQVLEKLIDRRRGLGWFVDTNGIGSVAIRVFTVFDNDIAVDDKVFPANPNQFDIDLSAAIDVIDPVIKLSEVNAYDKIIVQGERAVSCFSVSFTDSTLTRGWSTARETIYKLFDDKDRQIDVVKSVYQRFIIPENWNWIAGDGIGGDGNFVAPFFDAGSNHDTTQTGPYWNGGKALLSWIPLDKYADVTEKDVEPPLAFYKKPGTAEYYSVDQNSDKELPTAILRVLPVGLGVTIEPKANHLLALSHFDTEDSGTTTSEDTPQVDYESLILTVAMRTDSRPIVEVITGNQAETQRTLVINVDGAEYWYILPGTVLSVQGGALSRSSGETARDDRDKLRSLAALLKSWYGQYRSAVKFGVQNISTIAPLGSLIKSIANAWQREPVGTIVTSRSWDFRGARTTINTGYYNLDFAVILDIPGMSDFRSVGRAFNRQQQEISELKRSLGEIPRRFSMQSRETVASTAATTVDFIVDLFDRGDADNLGEYWINPSNFAIRSGNAYDVSTTNVNTFDSVRLETLVSTTKNITTNPLNYETISIDPGTFDDEGTTRSNSATATAVNVPSSTIQSVALYNAILSEDDCYIRVKYNAGLYQDNVANGAAWGVHVSGRVQSDNYDLGNTFKFWGVNNPEVSIAGDSSLVDGIYNVDESTELPGNVSGELEEYTLTAHSLLSMRVSKPDNSSSSNIQSPLVVNSYIYQSYAARFDFIHDSTNYGFIETNGQMTGKLPTHQPGPAVGENNLLIYFHGGLFDVTLNGVAILIDQTALASTKGLIGLSPIFNALGAFQSGDIDCHIKEIKAWSATIPEPPSTESGHGTYASGTYTYNDGYHSGGSYDPTALD